MKLIKCDKCLDESYALISDTTYDEGRKCIS